MKLRQKIILLLLLIGVLPMLAVSAVAYMTIRNSLLTKTTDQLNSTAIKQEQKISTFLQTRQEEVTKLANQYDLQVALRQYVTSPTPASKNALETILQTKKIATTSIQAIVLSDLNGKSFVSSSASAMSEQVAGSEVPKGDVETTVTVKKDPADGFSKLYITTLFSVNRQKLGLLTAVFRTDEMVAVVQDYTGLDETGETVITTKDNISLFPLRFETDATLKTNLSNLDLYNAETYREATDYRGKDVLVVAHKVGLTDWVVGAKIDKDEALAATVLLRNSIIAIAASASLVIVLVALFFTRVFTRPILRISHVSEMIGRGDFTAQANIHRKDEIGLLARSVDAMGVNLKEMVGSIESQRRRLQIILDSTTEAIFAIDEHANVIVANKAVQGLLQINPDALVGKSMQTLFAWKHGMQAFTVDYDVTEVHTYSNLQYIDSKGDQRYVKLIVAPVKDEIHAGRTHAIVTIHDETSSHELENMKTDFVSMAAHELRTPLTAVRGYLEMVQYKQEHNDPTDVPQYVRQALKNVGDLGGLINNLLDVTRIERGTLTLSMEKVDIAESIARTVDDMRFAAEDNKLTLTYRGATSGCYVVGDPIALREIINNLLANAIKYTPAGGKVNVSIERQDDFYDVSVQDTGIGIPQKALAHLFTKFYRVHGGLDSGSTGTGLGLFIAKSIVERHHGTIHVDSAEGVGSTFSFKLPVFTDEKLAESQPADEKNTTTVRRKRGWITKNIAR